MTRLTQFWETFLAGIRSSGAAGYSPLEKNQAYLKVPDQKPVLEIEGLGFASAVPRDVLPHLSKPVKYWNMEGALFQGTGISQHQELDKYLEKSHQAQHKH